MSKTNTLETYINKYAKQAKLWDFSKPNLNKLKYFALRCAEFVSFVCL